jgi:uncharacterized protein YndB with AHSA1/START domain
MSNEHQRDEKTRAFEMSIDIDASPEQVWDALTKAEELVRWFPLDARVEPGEGGSMTWSWGDFWSGTMRIDAWQPHRLLRLVDDRARPFDVDGRPVEAGEVVPARVAIEVTLETSHGSTRLRLVHSGFGRGAAWDDEIDGVSSGWQFELRSLRHYLQRHRGHDRHVAWAHLAVAQPISAVWSRLMASDGFSIEAMALEPGARYSLHAATGDRFTGTIELYLPEREFFGTVDELDTGVLRVGTYRSGDRTGITVWAATYGEHAALLPAFQQRAQAALEKLFRDL